jgi:transcriptional regulator of PTS gene
MRISDKEFNRLKMLKALRRAEPVARTQLVELTGLASATITALTSELVDQGFLIEEKLAPNGRGRPRVQLRLNPAAAYVVSVFLFQNSVFEIALTDLRGNRVHVRHMEFVMVETLDDWIDYLASMIDTFLDDCPIPRGAIHSVGIAVPGLVNSERGMLHWLQLYPPGHFPIRDVMQRRLGIPVFVENTNDVIARAEHWFGEDPGQDNFSMVVVGLGLGFAQYADGTMVRGGHGANAEFGHLKIAVLDGPTCYCGGQGCLAMYCGTYGIVAQLAQIEAIEIDGLQKIDSILADFADRARAGDRAVQQVFDRAATYLGIALANHINLADPQRLLVRSSNQTWIDMMEAPTRQALEANTVPALRGRAFIEFKCEQEAACSYGAAALVLEHLYRQPS